MTMRLGQVLVAKGVLTETQVDTILRKQQHTGKPFGLLCEQIFGIDPEQIEQAWAVQYAELTRRIDPAQEAIDPHALELVTRRQAWQFRVLPIRFDDGELMMATTSRHLRRALRFATNVIGVPVYLVLTPAEKLGEALCRYYPLPGMTVRAVDDDAMDMVLGDPVWQQNGNRAYRRQTGT